MWHGLYANIDAEKSTAKSQVWFLQRNSWISCSSISKHTDLRKPEWCHSVEHTFFYGLDIKLHLSRHCLCKLYSLFLMQCDVTTNINLMPEFHTGLGGKCEESIKSRLFWCKCQCKYSLEQVGLSIQGWSTGAVLVALQYGLDSSCRIL